jgi:hypothetical protein
VPRPEEGCQWQFHRTRKWPRSQRQAAPSASYLDAGGRLVPRETAQFAVVRDFDDRGNVISLITERLTH